MVRHFLTSKDFDKEFLLDIFANAKEFEDGKEGTGKGKVLGLLFLGESTRTSASLKSAMIRLGGGWYGLEGTKGTYLETGEEGLMDTAVALADFCDLFAVRGNVDPDMFRKIKVPVINSMMGDDHTIAAVWYLYSVWKRLNKVEGLKLGTYGMVRYSRPIKSIYRVWSKFGIKIFEDSLLGEMGCPDEVKEGIITNGSTHEKKPIGEILKEVDVLIVAEALPQKGADPELVKKFNDKFKTLDEEFMKDLNEKAYWMHMEPRKTTDGRLTTSEALDNHPRLLQRALMRESVYCNMGIFSKLLEIK
jgi:aspartate carbamoyltransferase catalytic subunit